MKKTLVFVVMVCAVLCACKSNLDKDGVPHVKDVKNIIDTDGKKITAGDFYSKYCHGAQQNGTCQRVLIRARQDNLVGEMPKGW